MDSKTGNEILMLRREADFLAKSHEPAVKLGAPNASRGFKLMQLGKQAMHDDAERFERPGNGRTIANFVEYRRIIPFAPGIQLQLIASASKISDRGEEFERVDSVTTRLVDEEAPDSDPLTTQSVSLADTYVLEGDSHVQIETWQTLAGMEETLETAINYADFLADAA
ncbi:MAG: hypothetical protein ACHQT9_00400 [Candidatus Saccharimonadales bacterium]